MAKEPGYEVACILDDGSLVRGRFSSFNISADDSPDRDLILQEPLRYRLSGDEEAHDYNVSAVCIAARNIVTMFVNSSEPELAAAITAAEKAAGQLSEAPMPERVRLSPPESAQSS